MAHGFRPKPGQTRKGGRYDTTHQRARAAAARRHQPADPCTRCGHPLGPMGPWLHYDHTDDGTNYLGFAHGSAPCPQCGKRCNLQAGSARGNATQHAQRHPQPQRRTTRNW